MKRKNIFGNVKWLIVSMLISMAFFKGDVGEYILMAVVGIWILITLFQVFYPKIREVIRNKQANASTIEPIVSTPTEVVLQEVVPETSEQILMRHVNFRITDKLKTAFPQATWEWVDTIPMNLVMDGGIGRIKTQHTGEFNYADVLFGEYAGIRFRMLKMVDFNTDSMECATEVKEQSDAEGYDVSSWYNIAAQQTLINIITELNTKGHSSLVVNEDGSVHTEGSELETALAILENMPQKSYWEELAKVIAGEGLNVAIKENSIKLEW